MECANPQCGSWYPDPYGPNAHSWITDEINIDGKIVQVGFSTHVDFTIYIIYFVIDNLCLLGAEIQLKYGTEFSNRVAAIPAYQDVALTLRNILPKSEARRAEP